VSPFTWGRLRTGSPTGNQPSDDVGGGGDRRGRGVFTFMMQAGLLDATHTLAWSNRFVALLSGGRHLVWRCGVGLWLSAASVAQRRQSQALSDALVGGRHGTDDLA
jgi:hypothetical protein